GALLRSRQRLRRERALFPRLPVSGATARAFRIGGLWHSLVFADRTAAIRVGIPPHTPTAGWSLRFRVHHREFLLEEKERGRLFLFLLRASPPDPPEELRTRCSRLSRSRETVGRCEASPRCCCSPASARARELPGRPTPPSCWWRRRPRLSTGVSP